MADETDEKHNPDEGSHDVDMDEDIDMKDVNSDQKFKRTTFYFPFMPFSTTNHNQFVSLCVIYI